MKLCVLATDESWHLNDLRRAAPKDVVVDGLTFPQLADDLTEGSHALSRYDCILARSMPSGSLQQVIFRMDVLLKLERLGIPIVNPPRSIEMAVDKYLSLTHLQEAGIPIPPTAVSQISSIAHEHFDQLGGDVVIKPLFGSMGRGLERISSANVAAQRFAEIEATGEVIYQQAFVPHNHYDLRLLVVGHKIFAMKRVNPKNWISNLAQGATGSPYIASPREQQLALDSAAAVSAEIAGVDIVVDERTGQPFVVEVNSSPSWKGISEVLGVDIASCVLDHLRTYLERGQTLSGESTKTTRIDSPPQGLTPF